jgi:hypothetical protein
MRIILYLLEYIHGNNPRTIRDIMVKSKSRSIYTMAKKGRNILEKVEKYLKKVISVRTIALSRNSSRRHCGARLEQWCVGVIHRLSILVSTDVRQPIQKTIGFGYLMSAGTINHIFGTGCTMSADTNNVSGIRGVTLSMQNTNHGEILVCVVRLPKFPALCATASLDAIPSTPPPSVPLPPPSMMRHHANPVADPAFGLNATSSALIIVPDPHRRPRPYRTIPNPVAPNPLPTLPSASPPTGSALVVVPDPVAVPDPIAPSPIPSRQPCC